MQRIYLPDTEFSEKITLGDRDIYHQLIKVLRMKIGEEVVFFDGETLRDFVYKITSIEKKHIVFERQEILEKNTESEVYMTLYQAIPNKFSKLEYIVQKCVEIGYAQIVLFTSERSQKLHLTDAKIHRLQTIAIEATEQCGGNKLLELQVGNPRQDDSDIKIVFHPHTSQNISKIEIKKGQSISLYVGPEGGFSDEEISVFEGEDFQKVSLGERILRCETVGVVTGFFLLQN